MPNKDSQAAEQPTKPADPSEPKPFCKIKWEGCNDDNGLKEACVCARALLVGRAARDTADTSRSPTHGDERLPYNLVCSYSAEWDLDGRGRSDVSRQWDLCKIYYLCFSHAEQKRCPGVTILADTNCLGEAGLLHLSACHRHAGKGIWKTSPIR